MIRPSFVAFCILLSVVACCCGSSRQLFSRVNTLSRSSNIAAFGLFTQGGSAKIPKSPKDRDNQAIASIKVAIANPRTPSFPLIECEFPPLAALNKLGDGSLRSAKEVDKANLDFCSKLVRSIAPIQPWGPKIWLLTSSTATSSFVQDAKIRVKGGGEVHSLKDGLPPVKSKDVCVFVTPSVSKDYMSAKQLVYNGNAVVVVNGFAKDTKSIPGEATMAYFVKPLTYNSQVAGYLIRSYPGLWTTLEASTSKVLGTFQDNDILVPKTNTPDLRQSVRQVQKAVDEAAIRARQQ